MKAKFRYLVAGAALAAAMTVSGAQAAELVTNGGFETGDFTGWATGGTSFPIYTVTNPVQEGVYAAQIAGFLSGIGSPAENTLRPFQMTFRPFGVRSS